MPLFASVGIAIKDENNNVVFGPEILDSKGLVMSPTSLIFYVLDTYFTDDAEKKGIFTLQEDSDYTISYTNGSSPRNDLLEQKTREANNEVLISELISMAVPVPKALKKMIKDIKCREAFEGLFEGIRDIAAQQIASGNTPTPEELVKWVEDLSVNAANVSLNCIDDLGWNTYLVALLKVVDFFRKVESISELVFFSRDYFGSTIYGDEFRYYYNGVSYGYLKSETISPRDFVGAEGTEHTYEASVKEKITKYIITRGVLESNFTMQEEFMDADGLPFNFNRTLGDATLSLDNPIPTFDGGLLVNFKMGKEDSEFEIKPLFEPKGINAKEIISLKIPTDSLAIYEAAVLGRWIREDVDKTIRYDVIYEENGGGTYSQEEAAWVNVSGPRRWSNVNWSIYKEDGRYYLNTGLFLWGVRPTDPLTYPPTFIKEYATPASGGAFIQTYTKVE